MSKQVQAAKVAGVYLVTCETNGKLYINGTRNIDGAWSRLQRKLEEGKHNNKRLQKDWNTYGEQCFTFEVLEEVRGKSDEGLHKAIAYYIESHKSDNPKRGYNKRLEDNKETKKDKEEKPDAIENIDIHRELLKWLAKCDKEIPTSLKRVEAIKGMQDDQTLLAWVSSDHFRKHKQHKTKSCPLTEQDRTMKLLDEIAYRLVATTDKERRKLNIASKNSLAYNGKPSKADKNGKRNSFTRVLTFSDLEEWTDDGQMYYAEGLETRDSLFDGKASARQVDLIKWIDMSNGEHVMALLRMYNDLAEEAQHNPNGDIALLLELLDDMIDSTRWDKLELYIIECLKDKQSYIDKKGYYKEKDYNYTQIHEFAVQEFGKSCSYRKVEYRINNISNKLIKAYNKLETKAREIKERTQLESRNKQKLSKKEIKKLWIDKEAQEKNRAREQRYKAFACNGPVDTYIWSKEKIERYLEDKYGRYKLDVWHKIKRLYYK